MTVYFFRNNAIFMKNWRERMRGHAVLSGAIITIFVLVLILVSAKSNQDQSYNDYGKRRPYQYTKVEIPWTQEAIYNIVIFQGILILLFGSWAAYRMAREERLSGTLDFHRSSPSPRSQQVIGLLLGGPILEWVLFLATMGFCAFLFFITGLSFIVYMKFYIALIVYAVFLHALAVLWALSQNPRQAKAGPLLLFLGLYMLTGLVFTLHLSALYHLTWLPAYEEFMKAMKGDLQNRYSGDYYTNLYTLLRSFFGFQIPSFLLQCLVQLPLIGFIVRGISRKISHLERPIFSKPQWILFSMFVLFLYLGGSISIFLQGEPGYFPYKNYSHDLNRYILIFLYYIFGLGLVGSLESTPTKLLFSKGLRRMKKLEVRSQNPLEDFSSNSVWLSVFCLTTSVFYFAFMYVAKIPLVDQFSILGIILSQIVFFACSLEFFNLSVHHHKRSLFWTVLGVLWIALPILGMIIYHSFSRGQYLCAQSPLWVPSLLIDSFPSGYKGSVKYFDLTYALDINMLLAGLMIVFAARERWQIRKKIIV